jgi:ankyrin repeat protein
MLATGEGRIATAEQLLKLGANVRARNSLGQTTLHFAAGSFWADKREIVDLLIDYGADRVAADKDGRMPIDYAVTPGV